MPEPPTRRIVLQRHAHPGLALAHGLEGDRARMVHEGAVDGVPRDDFAGLVVDQLGLPGDPRPRRALDRPARARAIEDLDALDVGEQPRQILEVAPDLVDALRRGVDDDGLVDLVVIGAGWIYASS